MFGGFIEAEVKAEIRRVSKLVSTPTTLLLLQRAATLAITTVAWSTHTSGATDCTSYKVIVKKILDKIYIEFYLNFMQDF